LGSGAGEFTVSIVTDVLLNVSHWTEVCSTKDVGKSVGNLVALTLALGSLLWWWWWGCGSSASSTSSGSSTRRGSTDQGSGVVFGILNTVTDTIVGAAENGVACSALTSQLATAYTADGGCSVVCGIILVRCFISGLGSSYLRHSQHHSPHRCQCC
jgi:hypothetical protein